MTKKISLILIAIFLGVGFSTSVFAQTPTPLPPKTTWTNISSLWTEYDKAFAYVQELGVPEKKASLLSRLNYAKQQIIIHELILRLSPNDNPISPARSNGTIMQNIVSDTGCYDTYLNGFFTNKNSVDKSGCTGSGERWLTSYRDLVSGITSLFPSSGTPSQPLKAANLRGQLLTLGQNIQGSYDFSCPAPKKSDDSLETHFTFKTDLNSGDGKSLTDKFATNISIDSATFTVTFSPNIIDSNHDSDTAVITGESNPQQYCLYRCWNGLSGDVDSGYTYSSATKSCDPKTKITAICGGTLPLNIEYYSPNTDKFKQTWTGTADGAGSWQPVTKTSFFANAPLTTQEECGYRCKPGYHREGSACVSDTKETACGLGGKTAPLPNTYEIANAGKSTFTQTWNGGIDGIGTWEPANINWTYNQSTTGECVYSCKNFDQSGTDLTYNHLNTTTQRCESNVRKVTSCTGTFPTNATKNSNATLAPAGTYTEKWVPATNTYTHYSSSPTSTNRLYTSWTSAGDNSECSYLCNRSIGSSLPNDTGNDSNYTNDYIHHNGQCVREFGISNNCDSIMGSCGTNCSWSGVGVYRSSNYSANPISYNSYYSNTCTKVCNSGYKMKNGLCLKNPKSFPGAFNGMYIFDQAGSQLSRDKVCISNGYDFSSGYTLESGGGVTRYRWNGSSWISSVPSLGYPLNDGIECSIN